jgi:hypothetical protein
LAAQMFFNGVGFLFNGSDSAALWGWFLFR